MSLRVIELATCTAFQPRDLILQFTVHSLYFECRESTVSEINFHDNLSNKDDPSEATVRQMKSLLFNRAGLEPALIHKVWLTRDEDRLSVISGVAGGIQSGLKDRYFAGIWRKHMLDGLQWVVPPAPVFGTYLPTRRPEDYVAPSWSWASTVGPVSNAKEPLLLWETKWDLETWESALEVIDVKIILVNTENPFGQVKSGFLRVRARVRPALLSAEIASDIDSAGMLYFHEQHEEPFRRERRNAARFDIIAEYAERSSRENLWCIEV
ncbi:hypothetical protein BDV96DRAFT_653560 [Lophiotrema nucula]|uniref:Heterokaryon incompatibility domain-containing protein n=1 Tax=Lophiotrema nucula TaxID=690887 RepID=A0A6A5YN49_9PLEO|nr:hypothetical protein BDV96DRAFT_653560 [Lophiotrema nucula]